MLKYIFTEIKSLCYHLFKVEGVDMENKKGIFEAKDLACYIKRKYSEFTKSTKEITPIKMQKALYFCFAYWAGFVNKGKIDNQLSEDVNNILFDDKFEAWAYGPVVPKVYFNEKTAMLFRTKAQEDEAVSRVEVILNNDDFLNGTISSVLEDVFSTSDFKLVSVSHMDKCWQNNFNATESKHNREIPKEEIINEYTTKNL